MGAISLRKVLFLSIAALLFIVGCSNDSNDEVEQNETEQVTDAAVEETEDQQEDSRAFSNREALPFDINEFEEVYTNKFRESIGTGEGTQLAVKEETIAMINGSMSESMILLYTLNDLTEGNALGEYVEEFHSDLMNDTFYTDDILLNGLEINITATDINSVSVSVFKE